MLTLTMMRRMLALTPAKPLLMRLRRWNLKMPL
jgi:hypothetical protein